MVLFLPQVRERNTFFFTRIPMPKPAEYKELLLLVHRALSNTHSVQAGKRIYR